MTARTIVELWRCNGATADEWRWGRWQCEELLRRDAGQSLQVCASPSGRAPTVREALDAAADAELVGIVLDDVSYWSTPSWAVLFEELESDERIGVTGPATNETPVSRQRVVPPFAYSTPSLLARAVREHHRSRKGDRLQTDALDSFAFAVRRVDLAGLDGDLALHDVPTAVAATGRPLVVVLDTYVHRWASLYEQPRPDLRGRLPERARRVLDVGCATGAFGAALKEGWDGEVVGVEVDRELAALASARLDDVVNADLDHLDPELFGPEFDAVFCGDVLEHLRDPWRAVGTLAGWLRPGGRIVASVPNAGHWAIVSDLLQGQFDYVPFGLLCWGHLRYFTADSARQLFARNGLIVEEVAELDPDHSKPADEFIRAMRPLRRVISVDRLRARQILIVARKDG